MVTKGPPVTKPQTYAEEAHQLQLYQQAVRALGGIAAHARTLGFTQRHGGRLFSGAYPVPARVLEETAAALLAHADHCRALERQLSPAFTSNLTETQRAPARSGRPRGEAI